MPAPVVVVQFRGVRITQRAQDSGGRGGGGETMAAERIQGAVLERGKPGDVLALELGDGDVDVPRRPRLSWVLDLLPQVKR
ncbi:hypothetical protein [Nonomuraea sp. NPDC002799]